MSSRQHLLSQLLSLLSHRLEQHEIYSPQREKLALFGYDVSMALKNIQRLPRVDLNHVIQQGPTEDDDLFNISLFAIRDLYTQLLLPR